MVQARSASALLLASSVLFVVTASVRADIVGTGGSVVLTTPPADITLDHWESDTQSRLWRERTTTLTDPLSLDAVNTGTFVVVSDQVAGTLSAGTAISTYMVRVDSVGNDQVTLSGYILFDRPILGVLLHRASLNATNDLLGLPGVAYNTNPFRGVELDTQSGFGNDVFSISADRMRLDFTLATSGNTDDIRIVTAVPGPGGLSVVIAAGLTAARRRRRLPSA